MTFLINWKPKEWWQNWKECPLVFPIILFFGLHVIGLLWTSNFSYAWKDISNKVILPVVPLLLVAKPLSTAQQYSLFRLFISTVVLTSLINLGCYWQIFGKHTYDDIRGLSLFVSHIRYALLVVIALVLTRELYRKQELSKLIHWVLVIYLIAYTLYSQVLIGWLGIVTLAIIESINYLRKKWGTIQIIAFLAIGIAAIIAGMYVLLKTNTSVQNVNNVKHTFTASGNQYEHITHPIYMENGVHYMQNVCYKELKKEWNKRSAIPFDSLDHKEQPIRQTIIRYMTAKNLLKDSAGIHHLHPKDIELIENGIVQPTKSITDRIHEIQFQLEHRDNPNGHSILQRLEHWRAATHLIRENWLFGVGTGDVQDAFDTTYTAIRSSLLPAYRNRAHNYYLTSWITFGISGIIALLLLLYRFGRLQIQNKSIAGLTILGLLALSMLTEDTPETELGICIIALFFGLFSRKISSS